MRKAGMGRSIAEIAQARVQRELLKEAVQALLSDDVAAARGLIRDVIKGTIGYAELSRRTGTPEKSLVRMFGATGNPTAANLFAVLTHLQHYSGVILTVGAVRTPPRRKKTRSTTRAVA